MKEIATLGPEFSYSHNLTRKMFPEAKIILCATIEEVYRKVKNSDMWGIVPLENMLQGSVRESLTSLIKLQLNILENYNFPIHHYLASKSDNFKIIASKDTALGQCSKVIEEYQEKGVKKEESASTSKAMEMASQNSDYAAIGSEEAAKHFGLKIIKKNVEDHHENVTRFILISKESATPAGKEVRSSLVLMPKHDKPGLLFSILGPFAKNKVNLTRIESLPSGKKLGNYHFYIEIEGSLEEKGILSTINELKNHVDVQYLGSYEMKNVN